MKIIIVVMLLLVTSVGIAFLVGVLPVETIVGRGIGCVSDYTSDTVTILVYATWQDIRKDYILFSVTDSIHMGYYRVPAEDGTFHLLPQFSKDGSFSLRNKIK